VSASIIVNFKGDNPYSAFLILRRYVLEEIGLHYQNMITILGSIVSIIRGFNTVYVHLMSMRNFTVIMNKIFTGGPTIMRELDLLIITYYINGMFVS
jgi:hypothetical protein